MRPPSFNQPNVQNNQGNQSRYQGNNFNSNQNRGGYFNQGQVYQPPTIQTPAYQAPIPQIQGVSKTDFDNYVKANDAVLKNVQNKGQNLQNQIANVTSLLTSLCNNFNNSTSKSGTLPSQTVTNPREHVNAITTRSGRTLEGPSTPIASEVSTPQKESEQNPETSMDKVQKPSSESTAQVPPPEEEDSIFIEIPKPKAKKTVNVKKILILQDLILPEKLEDPGKFLIPCALQELDRTSALADSGASINLLPHSIYKQLGLGALTPTRMTLKLANRSITHPMGIAEDVVVRVDGKEELVYYADKSEKNKDFSKADLFSGSTTNILPPSYSPMKTSDNFEKFTDELAPLDSLPPGNDDSTIKDLHEENFQVYSNPLFEFDDNFKSSNVNPLFEENDKDVEIKSSSFFTLTLPEESEFEAYPERDSIPP
ncbi:reverse transcriptase domain-containing protein, partial [Tanacetum coccineum]